MQDGAAAESHEYALERSDAERQRLILQDRVIGRRTESFLRAAGLGPGMRVLDVGCGAGDVSLLVARIIGASGSVLGVDVDGASIEIAQRRAAAAKSTNIEFLTTDIGAVVLEADFDAVVGRLILMHLPDPPLVLRRVAHALRVGGLLAFQEVHLASPWLSFPSSPSLERVQQLRARALAGGQPVNPHMGLALRDTFLRAGLNDPTIQSDVVVVSGKDLDGYELIEQTVRSLLPGWLRRGVEGSDRLNSRDLGTRLRNEIGDHGAIMLYPLIGAWTRLES
jgi:ubiquinone/menaquinone biosynthesis C-methylase UbiE